MSLTILKLIEWAYVKQLCSIVRHGEVVSEKHLQVVSVSNQSSAPLVEEFTRLDMAALNNTRNVSSCMLCSVKFIPGESQIYMTSRGFQ
jgi:hypothetical protein